MRKIFSIILILTVAFTLLTPIMNSFADDYMKISYVTDKKGVEKMLSLASGHNLSGYTTYEKAKSMIEHVVYDASFASFYNKKFYYPNSGSYVYYINDGTYNVSINGAKGCLAYSNYVESLIYGVHGPKKFHTESPGNLTGDGIKAFLKKEAQIGEHIRIYDKHSVSYISSDDNGFYYTNYTNDTRKVTELCYVTFEEFADYYNCVKYSEYSSSVWIYNGNKNVNDVTTQQTQQNTNVCPHTAYDDRGYCKKCKSEYKPKITTISDMSFTAVKDKVPVRKRPYSADKIIKYLNKGQKVTVVGYAYNGYGNFWYKIKDGTWIYSGNLIEADPSLRLTISTSEHSKLSKNSVSLKALCSYTGVRPSEVGLYLGTTPSSMTVYERDSINFSKNPFDIWYDLSGLKEGTTYYYRFYAKINGREIAGEKKLFTTQGKSKDMAAIEDPITALGVKVNLSATTKITTSTARVNGNCSYTNVKPTEVGLKLGYAENALVKVASDKIDFSKNPFDIWYDLKDLKAGTTYYYALYAIANGAEIISDTGKFTTAKGTTSTLVNELPTEYLKITVGAVTNLTTTTAKVNASCSYTGTRPTEVGLYLGTNASSLRKNASDKINFSKNPFDIWYELKNLTPGTTYYYKIYAIVDGKNILSELKSFTTAKGTTSALVNALPAENTRKGVVTGTNGDNLAINDKAAASPKYSNEIGIIPPGAEMTVYPDKSVGNWYYVVYNGIAGYAYGKYITLK